MPEFDNDLDRLKAALKGAPAPDGPSRDAAFIVAEETFARLQEAGGFARPTETQGQQAGFLKGLTSMFSRKALKPLLLTTSSLVVIGVSIVVVQDTRQPDQAVVEPTVRSTRLNPDLRVTPQDLANSGPRDLLAREADRRNTKVIPAPAKPAQSAPARPLGETLTEAAPTTAPSTGGVQLTGRAEMALQDGGLFQASPEVPFAPSGEPNNDLTFGNSVVLKESIEEEIITAPPNTNRFANQPSNPLKITSEEPVSTFSTDVDTASYAWVRRALQNGQLPDPASIRVEEMVNYFPYDYAAPDGDAPFATTVSVSETPWNAATQIVHIGLQGEMPATEDRPPLNLVFLIDTSGSMNSPDKLPLLIQSFRLMLSELRPQDEVAIVTYAGSAGMVLEPTAASETGTINAALANLRSGGSTAGEAGLQQAYSVADWMAEDGEISRVILATDGDFNVGQSSDAQMKTLIEQKRDSGTYLSVLGFGRGNINDSLMQTLAQNGNGQAAYIDTLSEARKVLVDQLTGALFPIAGDVKVQVEWNPALVAEYRLIGYETRALKREDFNNDKVDAGDIGAGLQVTALYEVTPTGSPAILNDPLRYGQAVATSDGEELGFLRLRYKEPGAQTSKLLETPITDTAPLTQDASFAASIAGFGQLLRGSDYLGDWGYADAINLAADSKGADRFGYRAEAITLMRLAESLSKGR